MANKIKKILVIVANPLSRYDNRAMTINELCAAFCEGINYSNIEIDYLDLYKEDFDPVHNPDTRDTQTIEYQIRIRKADMIAIFHPVWWGLMPAVLKGFCDKVFQSGFAYQYQRGRLIPLLDNKKALVVSVSKEPKWRDRLVYGNILQLFWKRAVFQTCGIRSKHISYYNLRKVDDETISQWKKELRTFGENIPLKKSIMEMI